ncbi:MAG: hypothetical protein CL842_04970 [Crocinitomicaceae bacterium]|nr:hypothetical protein [Crocinitomicaceae bacterium]
MLSHNNGFYPFTLNLHFDILIVGAGPAGCITAFQISKTNPELKVAIIDKASFPRDKNVAMP